MIFDFSLLFSNKQAITATAPSSRNGEATIFDQGPIGTAFGHGKRLAVNLGAGACIPFVAQVTEAFAAAGAATLTVQIQTSDDETFATGVVTVASSGAIPVADLKPGFRLLPNQFIPEGVNGRGVTKRYMRLNYVVGTGPFTAGRVMAGVVLATDTNPLTVY